MKKTFIVSLAMIFLFPSTAFAVKVITPNSNAEVRIQNNVNSTGPVKQQISQKVEARGEEIQIKLTATVRERVRSYFARAVTRIEALIERLNNLVARIEARIAKINEEDSDLDTSSAEKDIADAKVKIASAEKKLADAQTALEGALSSEDPKDSFGGVVELIRGIKSDLQEVHRLLVHSIGELKGLRVGDTNEE